MVLKPTKPKEPVMSEFENDVKMYGTQTLQKVQLILEQFENDVKMYGTQTLQPYNHAEHSFENDVKMYGTQTFVWGSRIAVAV